jgi:hypothetical protein
MCGEPIKHVFFFTNTGNAELVLNKVFAHCGCTQVGEWTPRVKPGETGIIEAGINSLAAAGEAVSKSVSVYCNDPAHSTLGLELRGAIWAPIQVRPGLAVLNCTPDAAFSSALVEISNRLSQPLLLSSPQWTNDAFAVELRTNVFGLFYSLSISNRVALLGPTEMRVTLKTSVTNLPPLNILVLATVSPTVRIVPAQINLPTSRPAGLPQSAFLTLLNNSTNPVSLFEPKADLPGVSVSIKETKPGKSFTVELSFPANFRLPSDRAAWFALRTTHPQLPLITVPIRQAVRPVPVAPILRQEARDIVTAPLPLSFQREAQATLKLSEEQRQDIDQLTAQFIEEIGSQRPSDPEYLARWQKARAKSDEGLAGVIGRDAMAQVESLATPQE